MRIRTGFEITYDCPAPTPMMLTLSVHPTRRHDLETPDWIQTNPAVDVRQYIDGFGNICSRILAPAGRTVLSADFVIHDSGEVDEYAPHAEQIAVHNLPDDVLVFLPACGWVEFDPTNGIVGNTDLVRVAIARDPRQATPLHGTYAGRASDYLGMDVEVDVRAEPEVLSQPTAQRAVALAR